MDAQTPPINPHVQPPKAPWLLRVVNRMLVLPSVLWQLPVLVMSLQKDIWQITEWINDQQPQSEEKSTEKSEEYHVVMQRIESLHQRLHELRTDLDALRVPFMENWGLYNPEQMQALHNAVAYLSQEIEVLKAR